MILEPVFSHEWTPAGVAVRLMRAGLLGREAAPVSSWADIARGRTLAGVAMLLDLVERTGVDVAADPALGSLSVNSTGVSIMLSPRSAAGLTEPQSRSIGLPGSTPYTLNLQSSGNIAQPAFSIRAEWLDSSGRPLIGVARMGAMLELGNARYRIPEPLYSIVAAVDGLTDGTGDDGTRFRRLAVIDDLIRHEGGDTRPVNADGYIRNTRIVHAAAFSLRFRTDGGGFQFDPVLFGRHVKERAGSGAPVSESEALLTEAMQDVFARDRFSAYPDCRDRYGLSAGVYVYVDPALKGALGVVRRLQDADQETRRDFARNPRVFLKDELGETLDEALIEDLFVETEQYSERIVDIGVWEPVHLPWLETQPNTWLPERFAVSLDGVGVRLTPEDVEPLRVAVDVALKNGDTSVSFAGQTIPATAAAVNELARLNGLIRPAMQPAETRANTGDEKEGGDGKPWFLLVKENFERSEYRKARYPRTATAPTGPPGTVRAALKPHQVSGLDWLQKAWLQGIPGVLLADDMGLGKSLQALAFLSWVQNLRQTSGDAVSGPVLVVAPTGLLENWKKEAKLHLHDPGMGEICEAYGAGLKALRAGSGRDIHRRMPMLDTQMIRRADWVLTTYETLRDYHHSFAAIRFSAIAFDEIQKLKNPASQLARAAKALNADFMLALTGTPVENRIEDLWAILDIAYPGFLSASLKAFTEDYKPDDIEALRRLRADLMDPSDGALPVMMRRMKVDHVEGLPAKHVHRRPETMPPEQAKTYADVVESAQLGRIGMLEALHGMRGASLHPVGPEQGRGIDANRYCDMSARLRTTFVILLEIQRKGEKALIFLESLEMQALLAVIIKQRFGLKLEPLRINGNLVGKARLDAVEAFEDRAKRGFDVMILSPKAGGVGLNITAANHVIHLSRWWNPAVEDQCTDRAYRIGQEKDVHVYYPQAIHPSPELRSFDLIVDELLERKRRLSADLLIAPVLPGDEGELYSATVGAMPIPSNHREGSDPDVSIEEIDRMEPKAFEDWVLHRAQLLGYRSNRTPVTGDAGADGIIVHAAGERIFVQCKHRQPETRCDDEAIIDLLKARQSYDGSDRLIAITNAAGFTAKAKERADRFGVILIARDRVTAWPHGCL